MRSCSVWLFLRAFGWVIASGPLLLVGALAPSASSSPSQTWLSVSALPATVKNSSAFCQGERLRYSIQRWQMISNLPVNEALVQIQRELTQAQSLGLLPLSVATLKHVLRTYPSRDRFALDAVALDRNQVLRFWDAVTTLAETLPSSHAALKTQVLTEAALAHRQGKQNTRALAALHSAILAAARIQGTVPTLEAQTDLAQAWLALGRPVDAVAPMGVAATLLERGQVTQEIDRWMLRLVDLAVQTRQPQRAQTILQASPKAKLENRTQAQVKIAAAYAQNQDFTRAHSLIDPLVEKTWALTSSEAHDAALLPLVLDYAPSLDIARLTFWANRLKRPALRARTWLAIAGEARKAGQTTVATQALKRVIAEGRTANISTMFGSRWDFEWGAEMELIAKQRGYEPELNAFSRELKTPHRMGYVVNELIQQKRFDEAKQLISQPLMVQVDLEMRDVSNDLLDRIAMAAARAGQPTQALQQAKTIHADWPRLLPLAIALYQGGSRAESQQLFAQATQGADSLSALPSAVSAQAALATAWMEVGRSDAANVAVQKLLALLKTEPDPFQQEKLLLSLGNQFGNQRHLQVQVADQLGLLDKRPGFVAALGDEFLRLRLRNPKAVYALVSKPRETPVSSLEFMLNVIGMFISQGELGGLSMLSMAEISLSDGPEFAALSSAQKSNYFERISLLYLAGGSVSEAKNAANRIWTPQQEQRARLLQRLSCY